MWISVIIWILTFGFVQDEARVSALKANGHSGLVLRLK
jgi:hypothetical protein